MTGGSPKRGWLARQPSVRLSSGSATRIRARTRAMFAGPSSRSRMTRRFRNVSDPVQGRRTRIQAPFSACRPRGGSHLQGHNLQLSPRRPGSALQLQSLPKNLLPIVLSGPPARGRVAPLPFCPATTIGAAVRRKLCAVLLVLAKIPTPTRPDRKKNK